MSRSMVSSDRKSLSITPCVVCAPETNFVKTTEETKSETKLTESVNTYGNFSCKIPEVVRN